MDIEEAIKDPEALLMKTLPGRSIILSIGRNSGFGWANHKSEFYIALWWFSLLYSRYDFDSYYGLIKERMKFLESP